MPQKANDLKKGKKKALAKWQGLELLYFFIS
jgi:hypothetical protein